MSGEDVDTERSTAPSILGETGLPLVGLTMGTDGALSGRFWTRVGRRKYERRWCGSVRVVGDEFDVTFMDELAPKPRFKEALKRTYSAWGEEKQHTLARLHCGVVGVGSVGAIVAESLARMGVETISLIDFDTVKNTTWIGFSTPAWTTSVGSRWKWRTSTCASMRLPTMST